MIKKLNIKKASRNTILESFRNAGPKDKINLKTKDGHIFYVNGILSKLDKNNRQYFAIDGSWIGV